MPRHTDISENQAPFTPHRRLGQTLCFPSPAGHTHRQIQVAVLVGDAAGKAGQPPVRHALGTEETAAARRPCRGQDRGVGVGAELSPTSFHTSGWGVEEAGNQEGNSESEGVGAWGERPAPHLRHWEDTCCR